MTSEELDVGDCLFQCPCTVSIVLFYKKQYLNLEPKVHTRIGARTFDYQSFVKPMIVVMSAGHVRANTPPGYPSCSLYIDLKFPSLFSIVRSSFPAAMEYTPLSIQRQFKSARSSYRKIN